MGLVLLLDRRMGWNVVHTDICIYIDSSTAVYITPLSSSSSTSSSTSISNSCHVISMKCFFPLLCIAIVQRSLNAAKNDL